jgi:cell division protein ZapE
VAKQATLLCFDEFQVTDVADAMILGRLFRALLAEGVVMVVTSNRDPWSLYKGGLNRQLFEPFIDLIATRLDVHHLDHATDYRLTRLQGLELYHHPLDAQASEILNNAFHQLTEEVSGLPVVLDVQGRKLEVAEAAKGVARMSFSDLCEAPLGVADYLALAENFSTLILSDIPKIGPDQRNAAKRFVTLIDILYEHKIGLIASAEVAPEELYRDGDGAFEFGRTVSRLREMQSRDYLVGGRRI